MWLTFMVCTASLLNGAIQGPIVHDTLMCQSRNSGSFWKSGRSLPMANARPSSQPSP